MIEVLDFDYVSGFIALCTDGTARFNNQNFNHISDTMHKPDTSAQYSDAGVQINKGTTYYTVNITEGGISANYTVSQYVAKYAKDSNEDGTISDDEKEASRAEFYEKLKESNEAFASKRIFASMRGTASTDFIISTNISIIRKLTEKVVDTDADGNQTTQMIPNYYADMPQQIGLLLGTAAGKTDLENDGVYVKYTSEGKLYLERNGENLVAPYTVEGSPLNIKLMVIKKNGTYYIYVNGSKSPVLTYTEAISNGGAFTFLGNNVVAVFDGIEIHDLDPSEDYTATDAYVNWMTDANTANKGGYFADDFSSSTIYDDDWLVHHGDYWSIDNGFLHTTDAIATHWDSSVCYTGGSYSDFILNFKIMCNNPGGWGSVGWRRVSPGINHQSNGTYLLFNTSGNITRMGYNVNDADLAYENSKTSTSNVKYNNQWQSFTLVVQGTTIRLYNEGKLVYHGQDTQYREGYIEFKGANGYWAFDDVEIIPLSTKSAPIVDEQTNIADELEVSVNGADYTSRYQSTKVIKLGGYQPITFPNFAAPEGKYNLSATLERTSDTEGYLETKIGVVEYVGSLYDLVIRLNPNVSSTGLYSNATLCLKSGETTITLDSWNIDPFSSTKTSYELDFAFEDDKLSVWIDNQTAFVEEISLEEYGVQVVLPEIAFYATDCGIKISNLAVFGGASVVDIEPVTITEDFTFTGENGEFYTYDYMADGVLTLDSNKAFIDNAKVVYLSGISANFKLDSSDYDKYDYTFGFVLGTGKKSGTTNPIYAVVSQKNKVAELYIGTTKLYSATVSAEPEFGDNIFWDDDDTPVAENQAFINRNEFDLSVSVSTNVVTFKIDGEELYSVSLSSLGVTSFKSTPGFVSDGVEVGVSDVTLSGTGAYIKNEIENITESIVLENNNVTYVENGNYVVSSDSTNAINNVVYGNENYYFVGTTFSSVPVGASVGFVLSDYPDSSDTVKVYIHKNATSATLEVYDPGNQGMGYKISSEDTYELVISYTDYGLVSVWVNDILVADQTDWCNISDYNPKIFTESANGTVVSDVAVWGNVAAKVLVDDVDNGTVKILSTDKESGVTVVAVKPDAGYQLVAGSLKFTDEKGVTRNIIGRYNDDNPNEFALYDVGSNVKVHAEFTDMSVTNITTATLGSSLHYFYDNVSSMDRIDGVRFLTRLYMPIDEINPQAGLITVNYNGNVYTVEDYGALVIPTSIMDKQGIAYKDLSFENKDELTAKLVSAKDGAIYYNSEDYLDFTVVITVPETNKEGTDRDAYYNKYYAREYVIRSYVVLRSQDTSETITIYGDSFTDSINNVVERMESEG